MNSSDQIKQLENLKSRHNHLKTQAIRAEATLEQSVKEFLEVEKKAVAQFGTADPKELDAKIKDLEAENNRLIEDYRIMIENVEKSVAEIDMQGSI